MIKSELARTMTSKLAMTIDDMKIFHGSYICFMNNVQDATCKLL